MEGKIAAVKWADETVYEPEERVVRDWREATRQHTGIKSSLQIEIFDSVY